MKMEIERKFLVLSDRWRDNAGPGEWLREGYLSRTAACTVKVRRSQSRAWLTVKSGRIGLARQEYEYEVALAEADAMLSLCELPLIEMVRYRVRHDGAIWDVDVFGCEPGGPILAEIELVSSDELVALPPWVGIEVTSDP